MNYEKFKQSTNTMIKILVTIIFCICLISSYSTAASAEVLFGASAETGPIDVKADYDSGSDLSISPNMLTLYGEANLLVMRIGLEYGKAEKGSYSITTTNFKAGWELGPKVLKAKLYGGYYQYIFSDSRDNTYSSLAGDFGLESKIGKWTFYGDKVIPLTTRFDNGDSSDNSAGFNSITYGIAYSPVPFVNLFVNYRNVNAESDVLDVSSHGYSVGAKVYF